MDKSADFTPGSGYTQLSTGQSPPFPQGFRPTNILLKQIDNPVLHEIQRYHHHKAFDLFPDLKLCRPHAHVSKGDLFWVPTHPGTGTFNTHLVGLDWQTFHTGQGRWQLRRCRVSRETLRELQGKKRVIPLGSGPA
ncbi:hypothetical protein SQW19_00020 [Stenotrophomonas acidaminiphila]|uniref:hypothetical protein n=1 Tax=Stenotrophomonas acidaminiphila TaxID=128780 RepID=UPI002ABE1AAF|nr:hypothetical protein [Stenotrophomonas acidaminiphila]WPU56046.1 hypothetical protein SQW19_00020 [Stenotrophomonas acidaminiphila]